MIDKNKVSELITEIGELRKEIKVSNILNIYKELYVIEARNVDTSSYRKVLEELLSLETKELTDG